MDLDDGYLGSGIWVAGIKDKSELKRTILDSSSQNIDELKVLEAEYINKVLGKDPLNMNRSSDSGGFTTKSSKDLQRKLLDNGTHHFLTNHPNKDSKMNKRLSAIGKHNFQTNPTNLGGELTRRALERGTHNFITNHPVFNMIAEGRHPGQRKIQCVHCNKPIGMNNYSRHEPKCKEKPI